MTSPAIVTPVPSVCRSGGSRAMVVGDLFAAAEHPRQDTDRALIAAGAERVAGNRSVQVAFVEWACVHEGGHAPLPAGALGSLDSRLVPVPPQPSTRWAMLVSREQRVIPLCGRAVEATPSLREGCLFASRNQMGDLP